MMALLIAPLFTAGIAVGGIQNVNAGLAPVCIDAPPDLVSWWPTLLNCFYVRWTNSFSFLFSESLI